MWRIEEPTIRRATLDFTSSGQGKFPVSQLLAGDVVLMNALELIDWDPEHTQILICEHCGTTGCSSGGWVVPRRASDLIVLVPAFSSMENDAWSRDEYGPPAYRGKQGTPYFEVRDYEKLRTAIPSLPAPDQVLQLEMRDAVRLAQLGMPYTIFGEPPEIELTRDKAALVVAASKGEPADPLATVESTLRKYYESAEPALLRPTQADEEIVYLFLDADQFTDWPALVETPTGLRLMLNQDFLIEPADAVLSPSAT